MVLFLNTSTLSFFMDQYQPSRSYLIYTLYNINIAPGLLYYIDFSKLILVHYHKHPTICLGGILRYNGNENISLLQYFNISLLQQSPGFFH